ncbi:MAG: helix-turn-helix transcriptional regulator [Oscillospiraceae bacterium]|nr:helix-turn-helix transcriptional regulator [Oscillospiraceae bacterium]
MNLGNKIQELRKQKNVTQEELAAELGVTAAAVSKWENNYTMPDILMLCALADFFVVTTDDLLGRVREFKHAVIAAATAELGKKVADIAKRYGVVAHSIHTDYEEAKAAAKEEDSVRYLISCYFSGYYGDDSSVVNLVSVAPTENEILVNIRDVFERYLKD